MKFPVPCIHYSKVVPLDMGLSLVYETGHSVVALCLRELLQGGWGLFVSCRGHLQL